MEYYCWNCDCYFNIDDEFTYDPDYGVECPECGSVDTEEVDSTWTGEY